jgi:hypothetical protein
LQSTWSYTKKPGKFCQKTSRHHKRLQQSSRMQNPISKNSVAFIYTNNDQTEKEYKKTISFILTSKKNT